MTNDEEIRNEFTGSVRGNVLQIGNVHGDVVGWRQPPAARSAEESLREPLWRLRREVREASTEVARKWGISSSDALSVRWRTATDNLIDHWENIHDSTEPLSLEGQFTAVRETYQAVRSKRLVILGQAGAGKTVLAHRLILDLLDAEGGTGPVPVLFSLGNWKPDSTDLQSWLVQQLMRDFRFLNGKNPATGEAQGELLVKENLILPVLDGFDEIPREHHRAAIGEINDNASALVVTSRPEEYREAVRAVKAVGRAAAIELQDVTPEEAHRFLRLSADKSRGQEWDAVFNHVNAQPDQTASQNLTHVLTTPLMVTLTRTHYNDTANQHPGELLDSERFPTTAALEDHLLDAYLRTIYSTRDTSPSRTRRTHWDPDRARHWLGYLADHLQRRDTHDLAWWNLPATLRAPTRILIPLAVVMFGFGLVYELRHGLILGLALGLSTNKAFERESTEPESAQLRLGLPRRDREPRTRPTYFRQLPSEFKAGLMIGFALALVFGELALGLALEFALLFGLGFGIVFGIVLGLANVVVSTLVDIYDPHATDPWTLLTRDRKVTLVRMVTASGLAFALGLAFVDEDAVAVAVALGATAGLLYLSVSAWGRWLLFTRLWLPMTGRSPWRTKRFLKDAYDRGVLRTTGAVYQFRHARLREHLASRYQTNPQRTPRHLAQATTPRQPRHLKDTS